MPKLFFRPVGILEIIPRGYRIAYSDPLHNRAIACPFGLHWLVRFFRRCWEWTYWYRPTTLERQIGKAISEAISQERERHERELERVKAEVTERFVAMLEHASRKEAQ